MVLWVLSQWADTHCPCEFSIDLALIKENQEGSGKGKVENKTEQGGENIGY